MNKLFIATISAYLILWFMSSCATKGLYEDSLNKDSRSGSIMDTDGFTNPIKIESYPLDLIPPSSGVQFYRDGIVFLSESKNEGKMPSGYISFGIAQAYYAPIEDTTPGQRIIFSPKASFPYPCDALSFSNNFGTMYFTKKSEKDNREKIFRAEVFIINEDKQEWTFDTEPLEFCKEGSIYSHPSISVDGSMMIFSSNNPESTGGMDLFITRNKNMKWSEPENLGKIINTAGNEIFPALDRNNNLFFSSDGIPGYGGYDIFICKYNGKGWNNPVKMTKHINSKNDEVAFAIDNKSGKSAFFTSRRISRNTQTQLYRISLNEKSPVIDNKDLSAILYDMSVPEIDSSEIRLAAKKLEAERMRAESILAANKKEALSLEAERNKAAKIRSDSILAANKKDSERLAAERVKAAKIKNDSILAAKKEAASLEAARIRAARLRADSLEAARLEAARKANPDIITYKVQFISTVKPKGKFHITVDGVVYNANEYYYLKEYRYTIGEFSTLEPAKYLQYGCRRSGYPQTFVVAFRNGERSLDMGLFK